MAIEETARGESPEISQELRELISALAPENQRAARVMWRDITAYAVENAHRLEEANRTLRKMMGVLVLALVLLVGTMLTTGVTNIVLSGRIGSYQQRNTQALCSLRDDVQRRVQSGTQFLNTHPAGVFGISAATLRVSIVNEQHTLDALSPLICPKR